MPQSLASVPIHPIFSTKHRQPFISDDVRESWHRYMATAFKSCDSPAVLINSVEDHVHALFHLARTVTISSVVEEVKKSSSKWIKTQGPSLSEFAWQAGYGAFGVSESNVVAVRRYIEEQREHHRS